MGDSMKTLGHFKTITKHKWKVMKLCFRIGLYKQGLLHDMSKYSWCEFSTGIKYYQGDKSPNSVERRDKGYSLAWLHHKGRNKHHYEYWVDYNLETKRNEPVEMPYNYVAEMFCDRLAASKIYNGKKYTDRSPLDYFEYRKPHRSINMKTRDELEKLLVMNYEKGEEETFQYIRRRLLEEKVKRKK